MKTIHPMSENRNDPQDDAPCIKFNNAPIMYDVRSDSHGWCRSYTFTSIFFLSISH